MKTRDFSLISITIILTLILSACVSPTPTPVDTSEKMPDTPVEQPTATAPTLTPTKEVIPTATETAQNSVSGDEENNAEITIETETTAQPEAPITVGPYDFPEGVNPLTGLTAENPEYLDWPPALVSISNFPASARPQSGLNSSPITFEIAVGEGMSRFLAVFYGQFPEVISGQTEGQASDNSSDGEPSDEPFPAESASIGPIRSGRLPYEGIRSLYSGFLVMASAWEGVAVTLNQTTSVYGSDGDDVNSASINVDRLREIAQSQAESYSGSNFNLEGMEFSNTPPDGGQTADRIWVFYSALNQVQWHYDHAIGAFIRYDIKTDNSGEFSMATDRLTGEPLQKENVIVIFAEHDYQAPTLININLKNKPPSKALLFRDGEAQEIFWTTQYGTYEQETGLLRPMRFVDEEGNPVALKPGQTWIHILSTASYYAESALSESPFYPVIEEEGTGLWLLRYKGKY